MYLCLFREIFSILYLYKWTIADNNHFQKKRYVSYEGKLIYLEMKM